MNQLLAFTNSDQINLYNIKFTVEALWSAIEQTWDIGIPSFMSHDHHRLIGWSNGLGVTLQPGLARSVSIFSIPEDLEESELVANKANVVRVNRVWENYKTDIEHLQDRLSEFLDGEPSVVDLGCAALLKENLAVRTFPAVFEERDKKGLVDFRKLNQISPGVFEKDGLLLFAHQYFRRSLSRLNTLNSPLLKRLEELSKTDAELSLRIALDPDVVGFSEDYKDSIELEYWWGPKFNESLGEIKDGITHHESDDEIRRFHGIARTEFWWYTQGEDKTFEVEELRETETHADDEGKYGCRFVHSILDENHELPIHLDGAIRHYAGDQYLSRFDQTIRDSGRKAEYTKLWRVDGPLDVPTWKSLISDHYRDNRLIGEYFGADEEKVVRPVAVNDATEPVADVNDLIPVNFEEGDGLRVCVSYHRVNDMFGGTSDFEMILRDTLTLGSDTIRFFEADSIELVKSLRRLGGELSIPSEATPVVFQDKMTNFPVVVHRGENKLADAARTEQAIGCLVSKWSANQDDRVISWNIAIQYKDRIAQFSFAGHVLDIEKWFQQDRMAFPKDSSSVKTWIDSHYTLLNTLFEDSIEPDAERLLKHSGVLLLPRKELAPTEIEYKADDAEIQYEVQVTSRVAKLVQEHDLAPAMIAILQSSECGKCHADYLSCDCSKYLDDGAYEIVKGLRTVGSFWSGRVSKYQCR